jgi:hypothetical protein
MGSYRTISCDRCKAEWPLRDNQSQHGLLHKFVVKSEYGEETLEFCNPCTQDWWANLKAFKEAK